MNANIEARLARIIQRQSTSGHYPIRGPAAMEAVSTLHAAIQDEFGVTLPGTLCEFWLRHDGLCWDDYKLWRVTPAPDDALPQDVLTESRACRTDLDCNFVALGGSSMDLYGFHCDLQKWTISSNDGVDVFEAFATDDFDAYFERLLEIVANDLPPEEAEFQAQWAAGLRP